jgi:hypothetical protein
VADGAWELYKIKWSSWTSKGQQELGYLLGMIASPVVLKVKTIF